MKHKTGRNQFQKHKKLIQGLAKIMRVFPKRIRKFFLNFVRNWNSAFGILLRYCLLKTLAKSVGENVFIGTNIEWKGLENLRIGDNVSIHKDCYIDASGGLEIGKDVSIAHNTSIITSNHTWENADLPIKYNPVKQNRIVISNDVWIGCQSVILAGVTIHSRVVVAAGSVVTKTVEKNTVVGGIPAKEIKKI